jgi:hypothetical protein
MIADAARGTGTEFESALPNGSTGAVGDESTQLQSLPGSRTLPHSLVQRVQFVEASKKAKIPFNWTATADSILEKLQRLCAQIDGTGH